MLNFIKYMTSKKSLPLYSILLIGALSFFALNATSNTKSPGNTVNIDGMEMPRWNDGKPKIVPNKYEKIIRNVMLVLDELHYEPKDVNNDFSKVIFKDYLKNLDAYKDVFTKKDIETLRAKFENSIDEELRLKVKATFFSEAGEIYKKNLLAVEPLVSEILSKPFDFTANETINIDYDKTDYPNDEAERKDFWRKKLKLMTLERYNDLLNQNEKAKDKKTNTALEIEAREKVIKSMAKIMEGLKKKAVVDEYFKIFVNSITQAYDPHSDYFPPVDQRSFNESMSGTYFGIGAQLREEDGNVKIGPLTFDSPSYKSGEVTPGDILLAVAEGNADPIDVSGYSIQDVVKIIRGKENTEVRLTLKKADGTIKIVKLIRKKLALESTFAKSAVINNADKKLGIIYLPEFYANFEEAGGRTCSKDVAIEILKLKEQGVSGIIMDLRNNGGGSLIDVVKMVGLFIPDGPVVQVKDRKGVIGTNRSKDVQMIWDGPLTVLVNEFSASASEIFAAAIQDYKRGIVIGSTSTFGKGTVQRQIPLNFENNAMLENDEYGSIKVTLQKFYRVNGGSTQLKGVESDIVIPDAYEYFKFREKDTEYAMPWDQIKEATYNNNFGLEFNEAIKNSNTRVTASPTFNAIKNNSLLISKINDKEYSLNLNTYRTEQKQIKDLSSKLEETLKNRDSLSVNFMPIDLPVYNSDKEKAENNRKFLEALSKDIYINEAVKVMHDLLRSKQVVILK
jgi:carboxyl-terminal processing protease